MTSMHTVTGISAYISWWHAAGDADMLREVDARADTYTNRERMRTAQVHRRWLQAKPSCSIIGLEDSPSGSPFDNACTQAAVTMHMLWHANSPDHAGIWSQILEITWYLNMGTYMCHKKYI